MGAPTALSCWVDRAEYSRFERGRDTVRVTIKPTGNGLSGQSLTLSLVKARRNRDVAIAVKTVTLSGNGYASTTIHLPDVVDTDATPLARRGWYFVRLASVANPAVTCVSSDFRIAPITVERMKGTYLFGADPRAVDMLLLYRQPVKIPVTAVAVSSGHAKLWGTLSYTGTAGKVLLSGTADAGSTAFVVMWSGGGLVPDAHNGSYLLWNGEYLPISQNTLGQVNVAPYSFSAPPAKTDPLYIVQRQTPTLSWFGGPAVPLVSGQSTYILRVAARQRGEAGEHFLEVEVDPSLADLPLESIDEDLLVFGAPMPDEDLRSLIDQAIDDVEKVTVQVYLEPTRIVTRIPTGTTQSGTTLPLFALADWDEEVDAITYEPVPSGRWMCFDFAQVPLIRLDELHGEMSNRSIITIPQDWIQLHREGGYVELVPYVQTAAWPVVTLPYGNIMRGGLDLPNFWHFEAVVGFKDTPAILLQLAARMAAIDILGAAAQASYNAISNKNVSNSGVSASVSFTTSAMYGIYSATILDHKNWIKERRDEIHQRFHGLQGGTLG